MSVKPFLLLKIHNGLPVSHKFSVPLFVENGICAVRTLNQKSVQSAGTVFPEFTYLF